jgi:hypothetical protein
MQPGREFPASQSKQNQIKPSKIAWIYLVLFGGIGTFQWVTAEKIKNFSPPSNSPPGLWETSQAPFPILSPHQGAGRAAWL